MLVTLQFYISLLFPLLFVFWAVVGSEYQAFIFNSLMRHGGYYGALMVDYSLNKIHIEYNHWVIMLSYCICEFVNTQFGFWLNGDSVYGLEYDKIWVWPIALLLILALTASHILTYNCSDCRVFKYSSSGRLVRSLGKAQLQEAPLILVFD